MRNAEKPTPDSESSPGRRILRPRRTTIKSPAALTQSSHADSLQRRGENSLDDLPLEVLHRILRLLPPTVFYRVLPRLSKSIRAAARTALPGCSDGEVGIICSVVVRPLSDLPRNSTAPNWWNAVEKLFRFLPRFEKTHHSQQPRNGRVFWAACEVETALGINQLLVAGYNVGDVIRRNIAGGWDEELVLGGRRCDISVVRMEFDYFIRAVSIGEQQWHAMRTFAASYCGDDLRTIELGHLSTWLPPEGDNSVDLRICNGVTEVGVGEITGRMPIEAGSRAFVNLFKTFPFTTKLRGICFPHPTWDAEVCQHISLEQRSRVQSVLVTPDQAQTIQDHRSPTVWPHALLHMLRAFPKVSEFGVISLGASKRYYDSNRPKFPLWGEQAYPSGELPDLTTLHIRIEASNVNEGSKLPVDILAALAWIENLPNLATIHLTFLVVLENWAFTSEQQYIKMTEKSELRMCELLFKSLRVKGRDQPRTDIVVGDVIYQITNVSGTYQGYSNRRLVDPSLDGAGSAGTMLRLGLRQAVVQLGEKVGLNVRRREEL